MRAILILLLVLAPVVLRAADDSDSVEDILEVLASQGLIDEAVHTKILTKHRAQVEREGRDVAGALLQGWEFSGDLRLRHEDFWFDHDATGVESTNRHRLRYRARLRAKRPLYDWLGVGFELVSGDSDQRGTNQTLGSGVDFDTDDVRLHRAWIALTPHTGYEGLGLELVGGKVANPFRWKVGKDYLIWDGDISLEGGYLRVRKRAGARVDLFTTFGYFVADENASTSDPKLLALQVGGIFEATPDVELGLRASAYDWHSLDAPFIARQTGTGNLASAFDSEARIGEVSAYVRCACSEDWPITLWGTAARNFFADRAPLAGFRVGRESDAALIGLELGDKARVVKLGVLYGRIEANALVSQFIDSDFSDGVTNREGWSVYGSRQIVPNVDFNMTLFKTEEIEDRGLAAGPFASSLDDADRWRLQTDLSVRFD